MKRITTVLILVMTTSFVFSQKTGVPDDNFENYLEANGYGDGVMGNDSVSTSSIEDLEDLNVSGLGIQSLKGIRDFKSLKSLNCSNNLLVTLDLSINADLEEIYINDNNLDDLNMKGLNPTVVTGFDVRNNLNLICIKVDDEQLYVGGVWANKDVQSSYNVKCETYVPDDALEAFLELEGDGDGIANNNYVSTLKVKLRTSLIASGKGIKGFIGIEDFELLEVLDFSDNSLIKLDVSQLSNLKKLVASKNDIDSLDLSSNINLEEIQIENNNLTYLNLRNINSSQIVSLNIKNNSDLTCAGVDDPSLHVGGIWDNKDVQTQYADCIERLTYVPDDKFEAKIEAAGWGDGIANNNLVSTSKIENYGGSLWVDNSEIQSLEGIQDFKSLKLLGCYDNSLTKLDISKLSNLEELLAWGNHIEELDLSKNTKLKEIHINNNNLNYLNLKNINPSQVLRFNVKNNSSLFCIKVDNPELHLNGIWNNKKYQSSYNEKCRTNIPDLNFEREIELLGWGDGIADNHIVTTSKIDDVKTMWFGGLGIQSLEGIQDFKSLEGLGCYDNSLTSLNISNLENLEWLYAWDNQIDTLDLRENINLRKIHANDNNLSYVNLKNIDPYQVERFDLRRNSNLTCVNVDDANEHVDGVWIYVPSGLQYNEDCNSVVREGLFSDIEVVNIYPTVVDDVIQIELSRDATFVVYNNLGQKFIDQKIFSGNSMIDLSELPQGSYIVKVISELNSVSETIIRQ